MWWSDCGSYPDARVQDGIDVLEEVPGVRVVLSLAVGGAVWLGLVAILAVVLGSLSRVEMLIVALVAVAASSATYWCVRRTKR